MNTRLTPAQTRQQQVEETSRRLGAFFPQPTSTSPAARARDAVTAIYQTSQGLDSMLRLAATFEDSNLSPEGLTNAREEQSALLLAATTGRMAMVATHIEDAAREAEAAAAPFRPVLDPNSLAQLTRTDQAWNNTIRPQLEAGKGWDQIVQTLDHDGILAAQRFAPGYEAGKRSRNDQHEVPSVLEGIQRMSEQRVVDTAPVGPAREALSEVVEVSRLSQAASVSIGALSTVQGTRDLAAASIAVKRATFAVDAQPVAPSAA